MNCTIKNIIKNLCEDGHDAMVEKRLASHLPIEDISPYEVVYDSIIKEFERIEKENAELREFVKLIVYNYPVACDGARYHCNFKYELPIERIKAALEGVNHAND